MDKEKNQYWTDFYWFLKAKEHLDPSNRHLIWFGKSWRSYFTLIIKMYEEKKSLDWEVLDQRRPIINWSSFRWKIKFKEVLKELVIFDKRH